MLVIAQRVVAPSGLVGINSYRYEHARDTPWTADDLPALESSASLVDTQFQVASGATNHVRSYLDLFAPEGTTATELLPWFQRIQRAPTPPSFPFVDREDQAVLRFNLDLGLVPTWRNEFAELFANLLLFLD